MGITAPPPPAPAPAPAPSDAPVPAPFRPPRSWSWRLIALGLALTLALLSAVVLVFVSFGGAFSSYSVLEAQLPASSTAVALDAPVEYRNVTVGTVASEGRSVPGGLVLVALHMQTSMLHLIPVGVRTSVTPVSFFGDAYIVLVPPATTTGATLQNGQTIPAFETGQTASLQETLGDLDNLLLELHPSQLDAALTALAGALQGQGTSLGKNLDKGNTYFTEMLPLWPTVVANLKNLVPVANQFAASTPDILQILSNQTTTGQTIENQASEVRQAIGGGADLAGQASQLLNAIQQPYNILTADSAPFLQDISQNPHEIAALLQGFSSWANAWTAAESSGPYLNVSANVEVANPADLGLAILGGADMNSYLSDGLGPGYVNPAPYSGPGTVPVPSAQASSSQASSSLASSSVASTAAALSAAISSAPSQVLPEPAQSDAISQIVNSVTGSQTDSPAVSTLLLSPVLEGLVNRK
jgi:phospholipid/cholesterol/gamma-HCH transport system substrate-binding protein